MIRAFLGAAVLTAIVAGQSFAQSNPTGTLPVRSEPETTTATYGVWTLRCTHRQMGDIDQRVCEVEQTVVPRGQQNPIAQIAIGRLSPKDDFRITVVLPSNITFQNGPRVTSGAKDPGVTLTWRRCVPGACIADVAVKDDTLRGWHAVAADTGRLFFTNASGQNVAIEFSFRGFGQAMDALTKEHS